MRNIRFDLELFGESGEGCAAEQSEATTSASPKGGAESETVTNAEREGSATGDTDTVRRIAALLGIEAQDSDSLVRCLTQRRARASLNEMLRKRSAEKTYDSFISEAEKLSSKIKGFDLGRELSDRRFVSMVRAGLTLEEAWRASHTDALIEMAKEEARREAVADALVKLRLSSVRPDENGGAGRAPSKSQTSVESLTGRGIRDILRRVENGAKIKF